MNRTPKVRQKTFGVFLWKKLNLLIFYCLSIFYIFSVNEPVKMIARLNLKLHQLNWQIRMKFRTEIK